MDENDTIIKGSGIEKKMQYSKHKQPKYWDETKEEKDLTSLDAAP